MTTENFQAHIREINFALYLDELYGEDITQGTTTTDERKARARALILKNGGEWRQVGKGQAMHEAFRAVYGEALFQQQHENGDGV